MFQFISAISTTADVLPGINDDNVGVSMNNDETDFIDNCHAKALLWCSEWGCYTIAMVLMALLRY